jgi:hypothetical protein
VTPQLKLQDNALYIIRATEVVQVNPQTGETMKRAPLPKEFQPQGMPPVVGPAILPGDRAGEGGQPAQPVTLVGVLGKQTLNDRQAVTLKTAEGDVYVLLGELKQFLGDNINPEGQRLRITGRPEMRPQLPQGIKGIIRVQQAQIM